MKLKKHLLLAGLFSLAFQFASAQFNQQWLRTWDDSLHQYNGFTAAVTDNAGNIILTGITYDALLSPTEVQTVKFDAQGNLLWSKKYVPPCPMFTLTAEPAVDAAGNIYIAIDQPFSVCNLVNIILLKYDSNGSLLLDTQYFTGTQANDPVTDKIFLDHSGNIYIGTDTDNAGNGYGTECSIIKFDSFGNYITTMITGITQPVILGRYYQNLCLGVEISERQKIYSITNIQQDSISHFYDFTTDYAIQKHDTSGTRIFIAQLYRSAMKDVPKDIFIGNNEDIFVTGETRDSTEGTLKAMYLTARLDSSGNILYAIERGDKAWHSTGKYIVADNMGYAYVAGYTTQFGTGDIELVKYDPTGNEVWSKTYNSPFNDYDDPTQMVFDPDGNLLISALSYNGSNYDALLLKYDTAGMLLDSMRYNSAYNLDDSGIGIYDNTGQLYLAGSSQHPANSSDYLLIKYGTATSAIESGIAANGFHVYPNPAHQTAVIDFHSTVKSRTTLILSDIMGREIGRSEISGQQSEIDLGNFESGIYFIRLVSGHDTATEKLVVQH